ncbi:MAG: extracellular solute-binding protein [Acetobacteraceae bacterium]|nr:extracellular solute-binding protein [Acetobacteraceae bacterium]
MKWSILASALAIGLTALCNPAGAAEVTLYTTREPGLIRPLLDAWTASTGTKVNTVFLQGGLAERVQSEGARSPADLMIVVDAATLLDLARRDLTQPIRSEALDSAIPAKFRDPSGHWFGLSLRARVIFVSKDRVPATENPTYEDLANERWKGRVCIRGGQHPYNTALFSAMLAKHGEAKLEAWLTGLKSNLARRPAGGDRDVAKDILAGQCDVGVANIYYFGLMMSGAGGPEQKKWVEAVRVVFPAFSDKIGTHTNISGAAVAKHAPNRDGAVRMLEFLVTPDAQRMLAEGNFEAPVRLGVPAHPIIAALGPLRPDSVTPAQIADGRQAASLAVDRVHFDQ